MEMTSPTGGTLFVHDSRTSKDYEIPITKNTISAKDFKKIKGHSKGSSFTKDNGGLLVYDQGLQNTAIKKTQISSTDAKSGIATYRGYSASQLDLMGSDFEDLFHLLVLGKYPTKMEKDALRRSFATEMMKVPYTVINVIRAFPPLSPAIAMISAGLSAYLASDPDAIPTLQGRNIYHGCPMVADTATIKTTAAYAVVLGLTATHRKCIEFSPATADRTFIENLFVMMGNVDPITERPDPLAVSVFRRGAIYNADNGMAHSTFILLAAASSLPDPTSCLISALTASYSPLHYGAQEAAWNNLAEIGKPENVPAFLEQVKRKERRLFGYGHRAYAVEDPRLAPIKGGLEELNVSAANTPLLKVAQEIDRVASTDPYFKHRGLRANADFYTVFLFNAMGFDPDMVSAGNRAHRILGLIAHWRESMNQEIKIFRPLHIYDGSIKSVNRLSKL